MQVDVPAPNGQKAPLSRNSRTRMIPRQGPWRCGNCPKEFAQKEYRDKHQRRCIQALSRQRTSKQISCVACAASKLGCDLGTPSCSRCINRNKQCQYVLNTPAVESRQQAQTQNQAASEQTGQLPQHAEITPSDPTQNGILYLGHDAPSTLSQDVTSHDSRLTESSRETVSANMRTSHSSEQGRAPSNLLMMPPSPSNNRLVPWLLEDHARQGDQDVPDHLSAPSFRDTQLSPDWIGRAMYQDNGAGLTSPQWQRNGVWPTRGSFVPSDTPVLGGDVETDGQGDAMTGMSNDDLNFDLLSSLGILARNRITPSLTNQQSPQSTVLQTPISSTNSSLPIIPINSNTTATSSQYVNQPCVTQPEDGAKSTLHDAVKSTYDKAAITDLAHRRPVSERLRSCPFHKLNNDDALIEMVSGYPKVMVRPGVYPPFVHHKIYRCAAGDVSEHLARAFCCIGAFYASVPTSESFVYSMINKERSSLVNGFQQWCGSDSDMLAVVHAMCIYQILGFFVSSNPEQTRLTEMQHLFFIKMIRQLIQQYLQTGTGSVSEEPNWRKWILDETIRRTVFLANAINTLSCRTQKQNPYYYEPLDDKLVRNMTLPAPEVLWKASSSEEWIAAKAKLPPDVFARSQLTIDQFIDKIKKDSQMGNQQSGVGQGHLLSAGNMDSFRVHYEQLDGFTRLVLSTIGVD